MTSYDCLVVGAGPGGYVAAIRAAQLGMRTAVVDKDHVGGRCLHRACIPAKVLLRSADIVSEIDQAGDFGIVAGPPTVDFSKVAERRTRVIATLTGGVQSLLKQHKVDVIAGTGTVGPEKTVLVGDQELSATRGVILATGSVRRALPGVPFGGRIVGTEEAWALDELPARMAILGAGSSGVEIASAYARLGTDVVLLETLDRVLPVEDGDVSAIVEAALRRQGVRSCTSTQVQDVAEDGARVTFTGDGTGDGTGEGGACEVDYLVVATGRRADTDELGIVASAIRLTEAGLIDVDGTQRTSVEGIWAIGDLVPGPALAHKASDEGIIAAEDIAGGSPAPLDHGAVPRVTFCTPNVASFGLTERQAGEAGFDVAVGKVGYAAVGAGAVYGDRTGLVKIVGDRRYGEILGAHIVGSKATDLIQELVAARSLEGGYPEVARMVHGHPTLSEGVMEAARAADGWGPSVESSPARS